MHRQQGVQQHHHKQFLRGLHCIQHLPGPAGRQPCRAVQLLHSLAVLVRVHFRPHTEGSVTCRAGQLLLVQTGHKVTQPSAAQSSSLAWYCAGHPHSATRLTLLARRSAWTTPLRTLASVSHLSSPRCCYMVSRATCFQAQHHRRRLCAH